MMPYWKRVVNHIFRVLYDKDRILYDRGNNLCQCRCWNYMYSFSGHCEETLKVFRYVENKRYGCDTRKKRHCGAYKCTIQVVRIGCFKS